MGSFKYIDYSWEIFTKESYLIMYYSNGGLNYSQLSEIEFNKFEMFLTEAIRIQKENKSEGE